LGREPRLGRTQTPRLEVGTNRVAAARGESGEHGVLFQPRDVRLRDLPTHAERQVGVRGYHPQHLDQPLAPLLVEATAARRKRDRIERELLDPPITDE